MQAGRGRVGRCDRKEAMSHPAPPPRPSCGRPITVKLYGQDVQVGVCNLPAPHLGGCAEVDWAIAGRP